MSNNIKFSKDDIERYIKENYMNIAKFCSVSTRIKEVDYITGETVIIPMVEVSFDIPVSELMEP